MSHATVGNKSWVRRILDDFWGYFGVFFFGGVLLLPVNPYRFVMKNYSQDLLALAMARCYPKGPGKCGATLVADKGRAAGTDTAGATSVSVVLLRDEDLKLAGETWPPSYRLHARVLSAIRVNKPRAIFLDIVFEDKRSDPTIDLLRGELQRYRDDGIKVYAARFAADRPLRGEIRDLVDAVSVPKRIDPVDRVTRLYDLRTSASDQTPTAALAVFRDICGRADTETETIRLFWRALPSASWNEHWLDCRRLPNFPGWMFPKHPSDVREDCPSTPTLPVQILLESSEAEEKTIESLLSGGIVLYGTHFAGAADVVNTPLHTDLPGVFLHATALENLMTFGPKAAQHSEYDSFLGAEWPDVIALAMIGFVLASLRTERGKCLRASLSRRTRSPVLRVVLELLGKQVVLLLLLITLASVFACRIGAAYWLSGLGINFLFAVAWIEILEVTDKLTEASDEVEEEKT